MPRHAEPFYLPTYMQFHWQQEFRSLDRKRSVSRLPPFPSCYALKEHPVNALNAVNASDKYAKGAIFLDIRWVRFIITNWD